MYKDKEVLLVFKHISLNNGQELCEALKKNEIKAFATDNEKVALMSLEINPDIFLVLVKTEKYGFGSEFIEKIRKKSAAYIMALTETPHSSDTEEARKAKTDFYFYWGGVKDEETLLLQIEKIFELLPDPKERIEKSEIPCRASGKEEKINEPLPEHITKKGPTKSGKVEIDQNKNLIIIGRKKISASRQEIRIMGLFMQYENRVLSRKDILKAWETGKSGPGERAVDSAIKRLRKKLGSKGSYIKTVRGVGYVFDTGS